MTDYTQIKSINEVEQHTLRLQRKAGIQQNKIQKDINNAYLHFGQWVFKKVAEWLYNIIKGAAISDSFLYV